MSFKKVREGQNRLEQADHIRSQEIAIRVFPARETRKPVLIEGVASQGKRALAKRIMARRYGVLKLVGVILICGLLLSCNHFSEMDRMELNALAQEINSLFTGARQEIEGLKTMTLNLLENPKNPKGLFDDNRYHYTKTHVYYTPRDDGQCEVWASGHMPIGAHEKARIKIFEHLCPALQKIYGRSKFIDNIYLTTYDSIVMGYPYADMQAYLKPGLDLTKVWVTYWAAAEKKNPDRKILWVEPYIDAVGRGYMTSIITPVYVDAFLEGTLGIDITVDLISHKFISLSGKNLMIVTPTAIPIAMNKNSRKILNIKGLENYNYLQKESENRAISSSLRMTQNRSGEIRSIGAWIQSPQNEITLQVGEEKYQFVKKEIPEVGWFLVEMKKK